MVPIKHSNKRLVNLTLLELLQNQDEDNDELLSVEDLVAIMGKLSNNFTKITEDDFDDTQSQTSKNEKVVKPYA